jgi:O-methyltransferase involved in polyketide biosynthesis
VVALGEGLETQFWRVDNGCVRWLTVDLPEVIELRQRLLPEDARRQEVGCSVLERSWMDEVDDPSGVGGCRMSPGCGRSACLAAEASRKGGFCRS